MEKGFSVMDAEIATDEEQRPKAALERMRAAEKQIKGYDLNFGRLRDVISFMLQISKTMVSQIESVINDLIPEFKEELIKERITFSVAYELSGMTEEEQLIALVAYDESGELTHEDIKAMKSEKAAGLETEGEEWERSSRSGYGESQGDGYEMPHPEEITSICYSCTGYEYCNVKTGTCTKYARYRDQTDAYKIEEQRYSEEQDKIDRETKKRLREMQQDEKNGRSPVGCIGEWSRSPSDPFIVNVFRGCMQRGYP